MGAECPRERCPRCWNMFQEFGSGG
ncbi:zinc finger domain-containing protein [Saccharopolyspora terrae]